jgi:hypothetical protein
MVNFLRNSGGGNRMTDVLREQLATSAAQRFATRLDEEQNPQPQQDIPDIDYLTPAIPALGNLAQSGLGAISQRGEQEASSRQRGEQNEQEAKALSQRYGIPIEDALQIAALPDDRKKEIIGSIEKERLEGQKQSGKEAIEQTKFQQAKELEETKSQNKIKLESWKALVKAKYGKDSASSVIQERSSDSLNKLMKMGETIPFVDEGLYARGERAIFGGTGRQQEAEVHYLASQLISDSAAKFGWGVAQQADMAQKAVEQFYKSEQDRQDFYKRFMNDTNPRNEDAIRQGVKEIRQAGDKPSDPAEQESGTTENQLDKGFTETDESWIDWFKRQGSRTVANIASATPQPVGYGFKERAKEDLKEKTGVDLDNSQPGSVVNLIPWVRKNDPVIDKWLQPKGRFDRMADSITREAPTVALAAATSGLSVVPLAYGVVGGITDEALDAIGAPEALKIGVRIGTSFLGKPGINAVNRAYNAEKNKELIGGVTNALRKNYTAVENKIQKEGQKVFGNNGLLNDFKDKLKTEFANITSNPNELQTLDAEITKAMSSETSSFINLPRARALGRYLGDRIRNEPNLSVKKVLEEGKTAVAETINNMQASAPELVRLHNQSNAGYAATFQLNKFEEAGNWLWDKVPKTFGTALTTSALVSLGLKSAASVKTTAAIGGSLLVAGGALKSAGAIQRNFTYFLNQPVAREYMLDFTNDMLSNNKSGVYRNAKLIQDAFVEYLEDNGKAKLAKTIR